MNTYFETEETAWYGETVNKSNCISDYNILSEDSFVKR